MITTTKQFLCNGTIMNNHPFNKRSFWMGSVVAQKLWVKVMVKVIQKLSPLRSVGGVFQPTTATLRREPDGESLPRLFLWVFGQLNNGQLIVGQLEGLRLRRRSGIVNRDVAHVVLSLFPLL